MVSDQLISIVCQRNGLENHSSAEVAYLIWQAELKIDKVPSQHLCFELHGIPDASLTAIYLEHKHCLFTN